MPKKQKIDKRLNKLFDNLTPEQAASGTKSKPKAEKEASPPVAGAGGIPDADGQPHASVGRLHVGPQRDRSRRLIVNREW